MTPNESEHINPEYIEINLTMYKSIGGPIAAVRPHRRENRTIELPDGMIRSVSEGAHDCDIAMSVRNIELRGWRDSTLAKLLSDQFMARLICGHFHINIEDGSNVKIGGVKLIIPTVADFASIYTDEDSIAGIECTVFGNGYLGLVIRFRAPSNVDMHEMLDWIKRPDQLEKLDSTAQLADLLTTSVITRSRRGLDTGKLDILGYHIAHKIDHILVEAIKELKKDIGLEIRYFGEKIETTPDGPWDKWSRPYVGVILRGQRLKELHDKTASASDPAFAEVYRLIIASARTTPEFYDEFIEPAKFLSERNSYGSGGSVVLIGARGWCVWDGKVHNIVLFRLGVVEMVHFVIMEIETSLRIRRKFIYEIQGRGNKYITNLRLNITSRSKVLGFLSAMVRFVRGKYEGAAHRNIMVAAKFIGQCYAFAPFDDGASVLLSHLKTHTARSAAVRYKTLKFFDSTDRASREVLAHYVSGLNSAISYLQAPMYRVTKLLLFATIVGTILVMIELLIRR